MNLDFNNIFSLDYCRDTVFNIYNIENVLIVIGGASGQQQAISGYVFGDSSFKISIT